MDQRTESRIRDWESQSFAGGYAALHDLADAGFSGVVVTAGDTWLFLLNGRAIGVFQGRIEDFEDSEAQSASGSRTQSGDAEGTVYEAPDPSLPLLFTMLELGGEQRAKYYTEDTPVSEAHETLSDAQFTGFLELSENVLSGDYYVVYYGGRSMSCAFVGSSERLLTGDEAFGQADDEVGIYQVRDVDIDVVDLPEPSGGADDAAAGGAGTGDAGSTAGTSDPGGAGTGDAAGPADASGAADPGGAAGGVEEPTGGASADDQPSRTAEPSGPNEGDRPADTGRPDDPARAPGDAASGGADRAGQDRSTAERTEAAQPDETGGRTPSGGDRQDAGRAEADRQDARGQQDAGGEREGGRAADRDGDGQGRRSEQPSDQRERTGAQPEANQEHQSEPRGDAGSESRGGTGSEPRGGTGSEPREGASEPRPERGSAPSHPDDSDPGREPEPNRASGAEPRQSTEPEPNRASAADSGAPGDGDSRHGTGPGAGNGQRSAESSPGATADASSARTTQGTTGRRPTARSAEDFDETERIPSLNPDATVAAGEGDAASSAGGATAATAATADADETSVSSTPSSTGSSDPVSTASEASSSTERRTPEEKTGGAVRSNDPEPDSGADAVDAAVADENAGELRSQLADREERIEDLEATLADLRVQRDGLREDRDQLRDEVESLEAEITDLENEVERLRGRLNEGTEGRRRLGEEEALTGTNLFVRYDSKSGGTLEDAHAGDVDAPEVNENLRLEHHTTFDGENVAVDGRPFEEYLAGSLSRQFVEWVVRSLLYEIRDTGNAKGLSDLYDVLPKVDRAELLGTVDVEYTEDGETFSEKRQFDVVLRDRMGDPLLVADINGSRNPASEDMMESVIENASEVKASNESLASAMLVTASFFEPGALEAADEATGGGGGLMGGSSKRSFVKLSRKQGYHLLLVETRDEEFHVNVPEL